MQQVLLRENKFSRAQEHFWIVGLNDQQKILFIELLALGASNRASLAPPEVFRMAIYKLATQAVLVHNHPGGSLVASRQDKETTDYLYKAGRFLRIHVLDHLVITEKKFTSFANEGLMDEIQHSGNWELVEKKTAGELEKMRQEIEKERSANKAKLIAIAKELKSNGTAEANIRKLTGLKLAEIRKL
ncbi:MAG: JAB domain-containing protein [Bacteroidetes bacterium]|nr:JAB domain-containing protein [Bacteroidota bacterium]